MGGVTGRLSPLHRNSLADMMPLTTRAKVQVTERINENKPTYNRRFSMAFDSDFKRRYSTTMALPRSSLFKKQKKLDTDETAQLSTQETKSPCSSKKALVLHKAETTTFGSAVRRATHKILTRQSEDTLIQRVLLRKQNEKPLSSRELQLEK